MPKTQINLRIGTATRKKLEWLTAHYGSQTQAVAVAIDRLYQSEIKLTTQPRETGEEENK